MQWIQINILDRSIDVVVTIVAGAAFGLAGKNPVCRLIADALKQGEIDKCFQQIDGGGHTFDANRR